MAQMLNVRRSYLNREGAKILVHTRPAALETQEPTTWTLQGNTNNFNVYYDPALGDAGKTVANGVLQTCEADYAKISGYFGNITPPGLPMNIRIYSFGGGAYHYGCEAVDLFCDIQTSPINQDFTRFLVIAEEVEVFEAAQGSGWDCGASNGEGLSRVLAADLYPAQLNGFTTASRWLDSPDRPDFVDNNDPTDRNALSTGCSVLYLNYLKDQLGFSWANIVAAGGPTLAQTYSSLGNSGDAFGPFQDLLQANFPVGTPSGLLTDDPFPLNGS